MSLNINNNPFIEAYKLIEYVIRTEVTDINSTRRTLPTAKEKQWIFPYTPEDLTLYYPRIALVLNSVSYSEFGSDQFAGYQTDSVSGEVTDIKKNFVTLNITVGVFTKKKDKFNIILPGKIAEQLGSGSLLNFFLFGQIQNALLRKRDYFLENNAEDFRIISINSTYEDTEVLFASDIVVEIILPNIWGKIYEEGELIAEIIKNYTVTKT